MPAKTEYLTTAVLVAQMTAASGRAYSHRIPLVKLKCISSKRWEELAVRRRVLLTWRLRHAGAITSCAYKGRHAGMVENRDGERVTERAFTAPAGAQLLKIRSPNYIV
jgi:hypothetical protein